MLCQQQNAALLSLKAGESKTRRKSSGLESLADWGSQAWVKNDPCGGCLRRQSSAAASASTRQNFTTIFCGHPGAEAMVSLTLQYAWLKCTLHDGVLVPRGAVFLSLSTLTRLCACDAALRGRCTILGARSIGAIRGLGKGLERAPPTLSACGAKSLSTSSCSRCGVPRSPLQAARRLYLMRYGRMCRPMIGLMKTTSMARMYSNDTGLSKDKHRLSTGDFYFCCASADISLCTAKNHKPLIVDNKKVVDANKSLWITTRRLIWGRWSSFEIVRDRQELAKPTVARESNNS